MRTLSQTLVVAIAAVLAMTGAAQAHHLQGRMVCDANGNGVIDGADILLNGVVVRAVAQVAIPGATHSDISGDNSPPSFPARATGGSTSPGSPTTTSSTCRSAVSPPG